MSRPKDLLRPIFDGYKPPDIKDADGELWVDRSKDSPEKKNAVAIGRPSSYTDELANEILTRLEQGETLIGICESKHMPWRETVYRWMDRDEGFYHRYERARKIQAHSLVEEAIKCVREAEGRDAVLKARVQSDLLVRVAGKLNREAYGEHVKLEHKVSSHADLIAMAQKVYEAKKLEGKTIDLVPEITATEG